MLHGRRESNIPDRQTYNPVRHRAGGIATALQFMQGKVFDSLQVTRNPTHILAWAFKETYQGSGRKKKMDLNFTVQTHSDERHPTNFILLLTL